jgi:hypothetical protein
MARNTRKRQRSETSTTAETGTQVVRLEYGDQTIRVPGGATATDLKRKAGIPDDDTLFVEYDGKTIVLHDEDEIVTYAADGATLTHKPVTDDQFG